MSARSRGVDRRGFLKGAGLLVAAAACAPERGTPAPGDGKRDAGALHPRDTGFDAALLASLGATVLPASLGADGQRGAVAAFVAWCVGYEPVAEEMHGYGDAEIRYLPPDPVPAWRAQLDALEVLARRKHHAAFSTLDLTARQALVEVAIREVPGESMPTPLAASHVAVALMAHWASSPEAWNRALGVTVSPATCRPLGAARAKPLPLAGGGA